MTHAPAVLGRQSHLLLVVERRWLTLALALLGHHSHQLVEAEGGWLHLALAVSEHHSHQLVVVYKGWLAHAVAVANSALVSLWELCLAEAATSARGPSAIAEFPLQH